MQVSGQNRVADRQSNFELLRIFSMLMIIASHFATHGLFEFDDQIITVPRLWWFFLEMGGNLGTDIFVLISGYYLIMDKRESAKISKILYFWAQTLFYSVGLYSWFVLTGKMEFSIKMFLESFIPLSSGTWWFASTYFVLYLIHPYLNVFLHSIKRESYQKFLLLMLTLWCLLHTIRIRFPSSGLTWFVTLYCVAGYIRMYGIPRVTKRASLWGFILFSALTYLSSVAFMILGTRIPFAATAALAFYGPQSVLIFLSAVFLVLFFEKKEIAYNRWINLAASGTFGVYLIHDYFLTRRYLWVYVFHNVTYQDSLMIIPYSVYAIVWVFTVCTFIELIRKEILEKYFLSILISKIVPVLEKRMHQIENYFGKVLDT